MDTLILYEEAPTLEGKAQEVAKEISEKNQVVSLAAFEPLSTGVKKVCVCVCVCVCECLRMPFIHGGVRM
jgi:hypothetical protein